MTRPNLNGILECPCGELVHISHAKDGLCEDCQAHTQHTPSRWDFSHAADVEIDDDYEERRLAEIRAAREADDARYTSPLPDDIDVLVDQTFAAINSDVERMRATHLETEAMLERMVPNGYLTRRQA